MYSKHTFTRKIALHATLFVVILGVLGALQRAMTHATEKVVDDIRTHTEHVSAVRTTYDELLAQLTTFAQVAGNESRIRDAFPTAGDITPFKDALAAAARRTGVTAQAQYGKPRATSRMLPPNEAGTTAERLYAVDVSLAVKGNAQELEQFLKELDTLPYYLTIGNVSSISTTKEGWESMQQTLISAVLYTRYQ